MKTQMILPRGLTVLAAILLITPHIAVVPPAGSVVASGVDPLSTAYGSQRKIAVDSLGNVFVTYVKSNGNVQEVILAESRDNGRTWSDVGPVSLPSNDSARSAIAVDGKDRLDLVWTQGIGYQSQIYLRTYSQGHFSSAVRLSQLKWYSGFPSIAVDSMDQVHVVWYGFDGTNYEIYYTDNRGDGWSEPQKVSIGVFDSVNPSIVVDGQDRLHVVWYQQITRHYQVWYREYNDTWNDPEIIGSSATDSYDPSIAVDPTGRVHLVWARQGNATLTIFYSHSTPGGWSDPEQLSSQVWSQNPSITITQSSEVDVFWWTPNGTTFMRSFQSSWSPEEVVAPNAFYPNSRWSFPYKGAPNSVDIIYLSKSGGSYDLVFARFSTGGQDLIAAVGLVTTVAVVAAVIIAMSLRRDANPVARAHPVSGRKEWSPMRRALQPGLE